MQTTLGLLGLAGFVVGMLVLSAGVTALVVKISPTPGARAAKSSDGS